MAKIKLTKNELKAQRDALKRFERYLPTLQLKKQQLQLEVRHGREQCSRLEGLLADGLAQAAGVMAFMGATTADELQPFLAIRSWEVGQRNIAGIDVPVFKALDFDDAQWDLFTEPLWLDDAIAAIKRQTQLRLQLQLLSEQLERLEAELRTVSQRVNLFEKVKIPEAQENIRRINIYIGDQQTNSVGRSKIAKAKCQARDAAIATAAVQAPGGAR